MREGDCEADVFNYFHSLYLADIVYQAGARHDITNRDIVAGAVDLRRGIVNPNFLAETGLTNRFALNNPYIYPGNAPYGLPLVVSLSVSTPPIQPDHIQMVVECGIEDIRINPISGWFLTRQTPFNKAIARAGLPIQREISDR